MRVNGNVLQGFNLGWKEFSGLHSWCGSCFGEDYSDLKGEVCNLYYTTFYGFSLCYKAMTLIEIPLSTGIHWHFFPASCWVLELNKIFIFIQPLTQSTLQIPPYFLLSIQNIFLQLSQRGITCSSTNSDLENEIFFIFRTDF